MSGIKKIISGSAAALMLSLVTAPGAVAQDADPAVSDGPHLPADSMEIGRKYVDWFLIMEVDSLFAHMTEEMQARRTKEEMFDGMSQMFAQAGLPGDMVSEKYVMRNGMPQYWYTTEFENMPEPIQIRFVIEPDGQISGIGMNPESQAPPTDN